MSNKSSGFMYLNQNLPLPRSEEWGKAQVKIIVMDDYISRITEGAIKATGTALDEKLGWQATYLVLPYVLGLHDN